MTPAGASDATRASVDAVRSGPDAPTFVGPGARRVEFVAGPTWPLGPATRRAATAIAAALLPAGERFGAADAATVRRTERILARWGDAVPRRWGALVRTADLATVPTTGRRLSRLAPADAAATLERWAGAGPVRAALGLAVTAPLKAGYLDDPACHLVLGARPHPPARSEPQRWHRQIVRGSELDAVTECDVVVVGTGAGGAVVAAELAATGHAVLLVEAGEHRTRADFDANATRSLQRLYLGGGTITSFGNCVIPVMAGRLVGGSTAVNAGTSLRTPDRVLHRWSRELGLVDLSPARMRPYFDRVEAFLGVAPAPVRYAGRAAELVAAGADALGWSNHPLPRNAPDCDGQGACEFGCPTGAKRSTDTSYVPAALRHGAVCAVALVAERILYRNGRAVGIAARSLDDGAVRTIRATAVVVAGGTLSTPLLLGAGGALGRRRHLGANLSIHPCVAVSAVFDQPVRGYNAIPQGWCVDEFAQDGYVLEGGTVPIDLAGSLFPQAGARLTHLLENYDRVATFGAMVVDRGRGRVVRGPGGRPLIGYWLGEAERRRAQLATAAIAQIFLAAGASEVHPMVRGVAPMRSPVDAVDFLLARPRAADMTLTAYHPLGTARMGRDARAGVVGADHAVFGVPGLYVVDGSVLPSSPEVNPQLTIMAMASRASDLLADRLKSGTA